MCYVLHTSVVCAPWRSEEGSWIPIWSWESFKPSCGTENITPGPLQVQHMVLTTETSVQLQVFKPFQWPSVPDGVRI